MNAPPILSALGDSLTAGYIASRGFPEYFPYTRILQKSLDTDCIIKNHGLDGDLTAGILKRLRSEVLGENPDLVLACGGANDLGWETGIAEPLQNMTRVVEECGRASVPVVLGAVPPIGAIFGYPENRPTRLRIQLNRELEKLGTRPGVSFVDLFWPLAKKSGTLKLTLSSDGLHLNKEGYTLMGELFLPAVQAVLAQRDENERSNP